jgi:hypothetical protein
MGWPRVDHARNAYRATALPSTLCTNHSMDYSGPLLHHVRTETARLLVEHPAMQYVSGSVVYELCAVADWLDPAFFGVLEVAIGLAQSALPVYGDAGVRKVVQEWIADAEQRRTAAALHSSKR